MHRQQRFIDGFTLLEILVAMAILSILMAIILTTTIQGAKMQSSTERRVSLDSGLRRTSQIITQDLRNATYGMLTAFPYASGANSFSVTQSADTSSQIAVGPTTNFQTSLTTQILAQSGFSWPNSTYFLLVNPTVSQPNATILVSNAIASGSGLVNINHAGQNTVCYSTNNIVQRVNVIGYKFDTSQKILYRQVINESGAEISPIAFGVSSFVVTYIGADGNSYTDLASVPASTQVARVSLQLAMERANGINTETRSLNSTIEIPKIFTLSSNPVKYISPGTSQTCS